MDAGSDAGSTGQASARVPTRQAESLRHGWPDRHVCLTLDAEMRGDR